MSRKKRGYKDDWKDKKKKGKQKVKNDEGFFTKHSPLAILKIPASESALVDDPQSHVDVASVLASIQSLPCEILCEIFLIVVSLYPASSRNLGAPRFTHVCRLWRVASFGYPQLWTTVNIDYSNIYLADVGPYISLSGNLPLHVRVASIAGLNNRYRSDKPALEELARALKDAASLSARRWKSLSITNDLAIFATQVEAPTPLLESLFLVPETWSDDCTCELPLEFLQHAPLLRMIAVTIEYTEMVLPSWKRQITSATYVLHEECGISTVLDHLADARDLEELSLLDADIGGSDEYFVDMLLSPTTYHTPKLRTLIISGCAHAFLPVIVAPALETLTVCKGLEWDNPEMFPCGPLSSLLWMIQRTALPSLRVLELRDIKTMENELLSQSLGNLIALNTLRIEEPEDTVSSKYSLLRRELLEWLTYKESSPAHLPYLTHLTLRFGRHAVGSLESLVQQLLVSRTTGGLVDGVARKVLKDFTSNLGSEYHLP
ncbi:hypothetical protein FB107DRAFT_215587 [Schizophyllum commune]